MLRTIWLKTIRDNWRAAAGWGLGLGLIVYATIASYVGLYPTLASRQKAQADFGPLFSSMRFLLGDPVDISTPGGFTTLRIMGLLPMMLAIWAVLAATSMTRGEEQPGTTDMLLATPYSHRNVLLQKWLGYTLALLASVVLLWLTLAASYLASGEPLDLGATLLASLNVGLTAWLWGCLALLLAQLFTSRGLVIGLSIGLAVYLYFITNLAGMVDFLKPFAFISPFQYYNRNKPLVPGWPFDPLALVVAPLLGLIFTAFAYYLVARRDSGAAFPLLPPRTAPRAANRPLNWHQRLLQSTFAYSLRGLAFPSLLWTLGISFYVVMYVAIEPAAMDALKKFLNDSSNPFARLVGGRFDTQAYLSLLFSFIPAVAAAYAVTQVAGWTGDEDNGLDEITLSTPQSRRSLLLSRFAAIGVAVVCLNVVVGLVMTVMAMLSGISFDAAKIWTAILMLLPFTLLVTAAGFALAAWLKRPGLAVGIVGALVVVSYVVELLGQLLAWPSDVREASIFYQYGNPALTGFNTGSLLWLVGGTLVLLALALFGFQRRDVVKG